MRRRFPKSEHEAIWVTAFILEAFVIIVSNVLALSIFLKRRFLRCRSCFLLINLTVADLLVGVSAVFSAYEVTAVKRPRKKGFVTCENRLFDSFKTFFLFFTLASLMSLALMAIERAFSIFMPIRHRVARTKHYLYGIAFVWLASGLPSVFLLLQCELPKRSKKGNLVPLFILVLLSFLLLIASYVAIYFKMRFYPVFQHNSSTQLQIKLCRTFCIATVASLITVIPHSLTVIVLESCKSCKAPIDAVLITKLLMYGNSFINVAVYALKIPQFSNELKKILCKCCGLENGSRRSQIVPGTIPLEQYDASNCNEKQQETSENCSNN